MSATPCQACGGKRLKPEALAVKIDRQDIGQVTALSVRDAHRWFSPRFRKSSPISRTRSRSASSRKSATG